MATQGDAGCSCALTQQQGSRHRLHPPSRCLLQSRALRALRCWCGCAAYLTSATAVVCGVNATQPGTKQRKCDADCRRSMVDGASACYVLPQQLSTLSTTFSDAAAAMSVHERLCWTAVARNGGSVGTGAAVPGTGHHGSSLQQPGIHCPQEPAAAGWCCAGSSSSSGGGSFVVSAPLHARTRATARCACCSSL